MKDYSKMSDFEINKAVATALGMDVSGATEENNIMYGYVHDYCNNPSDAWPIILEDEISLVVVEEGVWVARFGSVFYESSNPLHAAMMVYLKMKDEEK